MIISILSPDYAILVLLLSYCVRHHLKFIVICKEMFSHPDPPPGLCPWTPLGDSVPQTPDQFFLNTVPIPQP